MAQSELGRSTPWRFFTYPRDLPHTTTAHRIQVVFLCLDPVDLGSRVEVGTVADLAHHQTQQEVLQSLEVARLFQESPEEENQILPVLLVLLPPQLVLPTQLVVLFLLVC